MPRRAWQESRRRRGASGAGDPNTGVLLAISQAQLPETIHEEADAGPCVADHFGKGLLGDAWNEGLDLAMPAELGEQEQGSRQT